MKKESSDFLKVSSIIISLNIFSTYWKPLHCCKSFGRWGGMILVTALSAKIPPLDLTLGIQSLGLNKIMNFTSGRRRLFKS